MQKDTDNHQIISVFLLILGNHVPVSSGAGGSRTRVQTCCKSAFYTFSHRLVVGNEQVRDGPTHRVSSEISLI